MNDSALQTTNAGDDSAGKRPGVVRWVSSNPFLVLLLSLAFFLVANVIAWLGVFKLHWIAQSGQPVVRTNWPIILVFFAIAGMSLFRAWRPNLGGFDPKGFYGAETFGDRCSVGAIIFGVIWLVPFGLGAASAIFIAGPPPYASMDGAERLASSCFDLCFMMAIIGPLALGFPGQFLGKRRRLGHLAVAIGFMELQISLLWLGK